MGSRGVLQDSPGPGLPVGGVRRPRGRDVQVAAQLEGDQQDGHEVRVGVQEDVVLQPHLWRARRVDVKQPQRRRGQLLPSVQNCTSLWCLHGDNLWLGTDATHNDFNWTRPRCHHFPIGCFARRGSQMRSKNQMIRHPGMQRKQRCIVGLDVRVTGATLHLCCQVCRRAAAPLCRAAYPEVEILLH